MGPEHHNTHMFEGIKLIKFSLKVYQYKNLAVQKSKLPLLNQLKCDFLVIADDILTA